jgi:hypothetical protein
MDGKRQPKKKKTMTDVQRKPKKKRTAINAKRKLKKKGTMIDAKPKKKTMMDASKRAPDQRFVLGRSGSLGPVHTRLRRLVSYALPTPTRSIKVFEQ